MIAEKFIDNVMAETNEQWLKRIKYANVMNDIELALFHSNIEYTQHSLHGGYQLRFPWCDGDVVIHDRSGKSADGKVESFGFPWDVGEISIMTPKLFVEYIRNYYRQIKQEEQEQNNVEEK